MSLPKLYFVMVWWGIVHGLISKVFFSLCVSVFEGEETEGGWKKQNSSGVLLQPCGSRSEDFIDGINSSLASLFKPFIINVIQLHFLLCFIQICLKFSHGRSI